MKKDRNSLDRLGTALVIAGIIIGFITAVYLMVKNNTPGMYSFVAAIVLGSLIHWFINAKYRDDDQWEEKYWDLVRRILNPKFFRRNETLSESKNLELNNLRIELQRTISMMTERGMNNWHRDFLVNFNNTSPMLRSEIEKNHRRGFNKMLSLLIYGIRWIDDDVTNEDGIHYCLGAEGIEAGKFLGILK